ncbi:uncharacterized protein LOC128997154 [Macrosteles quadrilineatus]|uniref:uncharacterized protein LOC128997154 n=1 Tax=Macrosteles quadrilineatus TaxID=74068 RepID=UPI0023E2EDAB|nr:uncharacterized protein LOC128997154 [Macrosteles quadrilineatus]
MWIVFAVLLFCSLTPTKACEEFEFQTIEILQRFEWERTILPLTTADAKNNQWQRVAHHWTYNLEIYRYTTINNFFIFFYADQLVGVGLAYKPDSESQEVITNEEYQENVEKKGRTKALKKYLKIKANNILSDAKNLGKRYMFKHTVTVDHRKFRYAMVLFVNPDELERGSTPICFTQFIHFEGRNEGHWHKVPILKVKIPDVEPRMNEQGCQNKFGRYYFYSLDDKTPCRELHGFYCFYGDNGEMNGFGVFTHGMDVIYESNDHPHPVFRFWNTALVKEIIPHNARCIGEKSWDGYFTTVIFLKPNTETDKFKCNDKGGSQLH